MQGGEGLGQGGGEGEESLQDKDGLVIVEENGGGEGDGLQNIGGGDSNHLQIY